MGVEMETLMEENLPLVWFMVRKQLKRGSVYTLDELKSLALEGLWRAAMGWQPGKGRFSTYACKCIQGEFNKQYKFDHRKKRTGDTVSLDAKTLRRIPGAEEVRLDLIPSPLPGPEQEAMDRERAREIGDALALLQDKEREIIKMRYGFEGPELGWQEIGDRLGITRQAAQQCGSKAQRRIRRLLEARRKSGAEL